MNDTIDLCGLFMQKQNLENQMLARNLYARTAMTGYSFAAKHDAEYLALMGEPNRQMDELLIKIMDEQDRMKTTGPEKFRREDVFVWGGPTPLWGGSMEPDTSIRGMEYFGAENAVYVYGPLDEEALKLHKCCKRLICQATSTARSGGQQESDVQCAERLSQLSLKYTNIIGGIADDLVSYLGKNYSVKDIQKVHTAIKKHNQALDLYGVVYARELDNVNIPRVADCIDAVNLWIDRKSELAEFDMIIEKCRVRFPGKKIMLGVFMQDIGLSDLEYGGELMLRCLDRAEQAYRGGKIQSLVILGDREIAKYPSLAQVIRQYFAQRFA